MARSPRNPESHSPKGCVRSRSSGKMAMVLMSTLSDGARESWSLSCQVVIGSFRYIHTIYIYIIYTHVYIIFRQYEAYF